MGIFKKIGNTKAARKLLLGLAVGMFMAGSVSALPQGGTVVHGSATVNTAGRNMTINQTSQQAIINWNGFSISAGELVQFLQQNSSASVLNRVTGIDPSVINGVLTGTGNIFLLNPNGVLIGPGGMVNAGGFMATTLELSNADFLSGNMHFKQAPGKDLAAVVNQGRIEVAPGGFVTLLAPSVASEGVIIAQNGEVALGAGKEATVNFDGRNLLHFALAGGPTSAGTMVMSQASANNVLAQVVNQLDIEEAGSLSVDGAVLGRDILLQGTGDVNVASKSVVGEDIIAGAGGNLELNSQAAFDGGSIIATAGGNITFDTLIAEPLEGVGGLVRLTAGQQSGTSGQEPMEPPSTSSPTGSILMNRSNSEAQGIAADRVELNASGSIDTDVAANVVVANAPSGNVSLNLRPGIIDGTDSSGPSPEPPPEPTPPPTPTPSPSPSPSNSVGSNPVNTSGGQVAFGINPSSSSKSLSSNGPVAYGITGNTSSTSYYSSSGTVANGIVGGIPSSSTEAPTDPSQPSPIPDEEYTPPTEQSVLQQLEPPDTDGIATVVGANGTLVTVNAGGDISIDSVNTVIVDRISGRNVSVRSQTGSVVDNGDIVGADNRDLIASGSLNMSAKDFLGTVDDPLEIDVLGDVDVFAANQVDGISGVLVGFVGGEYRQNSETAGIVLLNPGTSLADGIAQAQRGVIVDNYLPGDDVLGGGAVTNLFLLRLVNSIDEDDWLEILRGTVVWEDSEDEASEGDL